MNNILDGSTHLSKEGLSLLTLEIVIAESVLELLGKLLEELV